MLYQKYFTHLKQFVGTQNKSVLLTLALSCKYWWTRFVLSSSQHYLSHIVQYGGVKGLRVALLDDWKGVTNILLFWRPFGCALPQTGLPHDVHHAPCLAAFLRETNQNEFPRNSRELARHRVVAEAVSKPDQNIRLHPYELVQPSHLHSRKLWLVLQHFLEDIGVLALTNCWHHHCNCGCLLHVNLQPFHKGLQNR